MLPKKITVIEWLQPDDEIWVLERVSYKKPTNALKEFFLEISKDCEGYSIKGNKIYLYNDPEYLAYEIEISE